MRQYMLHSSIASALLDAKGMVRSTRKRSVLMAAIIPIALVVLCIIFSSIAKGQAAASHVDDFAGKPRVVIISDIGNEPDDQMSLVRLLLYSNELDIEALIASTSTWQKTATHPETMRTLVQAYSEVRPNLLKHAQGWPEADTLANRIYSGQSAYGMAATGTGKDTAGSDAILKVIDRDDPRPIWICLWGGSNTLAQALMKMKGSRSAEEVDKAIAKLRISSISDQDDAGPWIRREFPKLFYVVDPSDQGSGEYYHATWTGISGDNYYRNGDGADFSTVTNEWLETNIRSKGPLGKVYPKFMFIMEGDTPSYLGLINNGLNAYRRPDWGGWGGRYIYRQPHGEPHAIWTQGGDEFRRVTSQDAVTGVDGRLHVSDQASIWRWRTAFQNDFAARMDWTIRDFAHANHAPIVDVNGTAGTTPIYLDAEIGKPITLNATKSKDPDGQTIHYHWYQYAEAGLADGNIAALQITGADTAEAVVTPTSACGPMWLPLMPCRGNGMAHVILAVTDDGTPQLTSYRRIILKVKAPEGK
jgi:hypothetical protein